MPFSLSHVFFSFARGTPVIIYFFQVKALQNDLHKNHFKATEERRIVAEIDKLNRSRRAIKEFNSVREEVDELKMTQKELRDHRDQMFKVRTY